MLTNVHHTVRHLSYFSTYIIKRAPIKLQYRVKFLKPTGILFFIVFLYARPKAKTSLKLTISS